MANNILQKIFQSFRGLDLRTSDILRSEDSATELANMSYRQTGAMNKRNGYQYVTTSAIGGYGTTEYNNVNLDTGVVTEEVITLDNNLRRLDTFSFTITYTDTVNSNTYYSLFLNEDNSFEFNLYDNGTLVLTEDLGSGTEGSPVTINNLIALIDAETNFTCGAATGAGSTAAAFIPVIDRATITSSVVVNFEAFTQVPTPRNNLYTPFSNFYANRTSADFENATFTEINDVLYIGTGLDELTKYDGNRCYRAGLPQHPQFSVADAPGGTTFDSTEVHSYLAVYEYTDAKQNVITGLTSPINTHTMSATKDMDVTVNFTDAADFNIDQAKINGTQNGVTTITVDDSDDLMVNDYVYLNDTSTGQIESVRITAIPNSTSITVDKTVSVVDNEIISAIKISLYRTTNHSSTPTSPGLFYLVQEFPNDWTNSTLTITDDLTDSNLIGNATFIDPIKPHGLPPKCKYIDDWRSQLVMTGNIENVNTVYYSDIDSPEYFPAFDNSFIVDRKTTGLKAMDNVLYIFKSRSIDGVTGDFAEDSFQVDKLSREGVGCAAHATIQEVQGSLFFLSDRGVYSINNEGISHVGESIEPKFDINSNFAFKQATGFIWQAEKKYCLFMPNITSGNIYANTASSETLVYDYSRGSWLEWTNYNFLGGTSIKNGQLYKMARETEALAPRLHKILQNSSPYDYADHTEAISFIYKSPWLTLGEPSVFKKFLRAKIHSYDTTVDDFENDTFTLRMQSEHDYDTGKQWMDITYDFSGGAIGWGQTPWGEFIWGETRLSQLKKKMASKKVKSLRVILTNSTIYQNVLISGLEFQVALPYSNNQLKE